MNERILNDKEMSNESEIAAVNARNSNVSALEKKLIKTKDFKKDAAKYKGKTITYKGALYEIGDYEPGDMNILPRVWLTQYGDKKRSLDEWTFYKLLEESKGIQEESVERQNTRKKYKELNRKFDKIALKMKAMIKKYGVVGSSLGQILFEKERDFYDEVMQILEGDSNIFNKYTERLTLENGSKESETEKTQNRSEAMKDNQNAKKYNDEDEEILEKIRNRNKEENDPRKYLSEDDIKDIKNGIDLDHDNECNYLRLLKKYKDKIEDYGMTDEKKKVIWRKGPDVNPAEVFTEIYNEYKKEETKQANRRLNEESDYVQKKLFINLPYTRCLKCGRFFFGKEILTKVNNKQKIKFLNFGTSIFKIYDDKKMEEL